MTKQEILKLAEFDERTFSKLMEIVNNTGIGTIGQLDRDWLGTILTDYMRDRDILEALAESNEKLVEALRDIDGDLFETEHYCERCGHGKPCKDFDVRRVSQKALAGHVSRMEKLR